MKKQVQQTLVIFAGIERIRRRRGGGGIMKSNDQT
jgi:hypothetical protein